MVKRSQWNNWKWSIKNKKLDLKGEQLGILDASLSKNMSAGKELKAKIPRREANIPGQRVIRAGE